MTRQTATVRVLRHFEDRTDHRADRVVVEEPLQVHLRQRGLTSLLGSTMRTPGHDHELAVGLAVAEGVVRDRDDVVQVRPCAGDLKYSESDVLVEVSDDVVFDRSVLGRVSHPSSACGMCGRDQIESVMRSVPRASRRTSLNADVLAGLPDAMSARQAVFRRTGGLHAAALATGNGQVLAVREDVGRHNAVDKVVGAALLEELVGEVLVISGRAGFEIVQKAAMAGIPVLAAVSAPTSLAVDAARAVGMTLAALVRGGRMTVYSGSERLVTEGARAAW